VSAQVEQLAAELSRRGWRLATAESCTGGGVAALLTSLAGSSAWFECSFVAYSNEAKQRLLGVPAATLAAHGAVSEPTALAMAEGACRHGHADVSVAVTGIAGPTGGSVEKPVGTVFLAWQLPRLGLRCRHYLYRGSRADVRQQSCADAINGLLHWLRHCAE